MHTNTHTDFPDKSNFKKLCVHLAFGSTCLVQKLLYEFHHMRVKFELSCTVVTIIIIEQCNLNYQVMEALNLLGKYGMEFNFMVW